jgi:hypothetical protein
MELERWRATWTRIVGHNPQLMRERLLAGSLQDPLSSLCPVERSLLGDLPVACSLDPGGTLRVMCKGVVVDAL